MESNAIERKQAASGNIDYASPVVLSESSRTKVIAVPFFISHSDHSELTLKIQTLRKANPPIDWIEVEEKSITLNEEATRKLALELPKYAAVAGEDEVGDYVVVRMSDGYTNLANLNPEVAVTALIAALEQDDIASHLRGVELSEGLMKALRYSVRLGEMKTAMIELRTLLDEGMNDERYYQEWCEEHPWAFGNNFVINDDIRNITTQDQVDILVPRLLAGFRDIIELKRPNMEVLHYDDAHRDYYFSSEVSKALGQCHRYLDVFTEAANKGLIGNEHIVAYHPEATIVMGRMVDWVDAKSKALHGLNARLSGIRIITYDHLLAQGESLINYLSSIENEEDELEIPF